MYPVWLVDCLELGECVDNVDVSTSDRMLGGWREVLYQKLRQNYRGSAARMTKLNINIIPWPNFRRGARCWALGFLLGWRGGEQETCYRLLTSYLSQSWPHASLDGDQPAVRGATKSMEIISIIIRKYSKVKVRFLSFGSGFNHNIQSQLDISTVAIMPCISV